MSERRAEVTQDRVLIGTAEAAVLLSASEASVKRWADSGALPCERTLGGHRRFLRGAVLEFAAMLRSGSVTVPGVDPAPVIRFALDGDVAGLAALLRPHWGGPRAIAQLADATLGPALAEIGERWEAGLLTVGDEHIATSTVHQAVGGIALPPAGTRADRGLAVVSCLGDEEHALAAELVGHALSAAGYGVRQTGARTPPAEVVDLVGRVRPSLIALSHSGASRLPALQAARIGAIARRTGAQLWVGGRGFADAPLPRGARFASSIGALLDGLPE